MRRPPLLPATSRSRPAAVILRAAAFATYAALLTACGNSTDSEEIWFATDGPGQCSQVLVDVDFTGAGASLDLRSRGAACEPSQSLRERGCTFAIEDVGPGDLVRLRIRDCVVPASEAQFRCRVVHADVPELRADVSASCACTSQDCDLTPRVCVGEDADPPCETCDNGVDDLGNGLVDCDDPDCEGSEDCEE